MVRIIGAGMAGLLAGNMLRHRAKIYEQQPSLPNNHSALLRFRTDVVATVLGISFKKVQMIKAVYGDNSNPVANSIRYSQKVMKQYRTDRSLPIGVVKDQRYIAPNNLIQIMAEPLDIKYDSDGLKEYVKIDEPIISTIPMPTLVKILGYSKKIDFGYIPTGVVSAVIANCDAYATLYLPQHDFHAYRASITGDQLIIELANNDWDWDKVGMDSKSVEEMAKYYGKLLGIDSKDIYAPQFKVQQYGKIAPIDEELRKDFMHWATDNYNIYSLGRYATWRPGLLLDDLVNDVNKISQWMMKGGKYGLRKDR